MLNNFLKLIIRPVLAVLVLLAIPLVFSWPWSGSDFVIGGTLIFVAGLAYEMVTKNVASKKKKLLVSAIVLFVFVVIWAELAVGLFGTPFAGN